VSILHGFVLGIALGAFGLALLAAAFAFRALVKVEAFEKSTHKIEWVPVDPRDVAKDGNTHRGGMTGDEETDEALDSALADAEERELDGLDGVHFRQGPIL
jgi:hypothetical protein